MANIVAGYFDKSIDRKKVEDAIENNGFSESEYIVYVNDNAESYLVSIFTDSEDKKNKANSIFKELQSSRSYEFTDVAQNLSYEDLKKLIEIKAKSQVQSFSGISDKGASEGMNDEVAF